MSNGLGIRIFAFFTRSLVVVTVNTLYYNRTS